MTAFDINTFRKKIDRRRRTQGMGRGSSTMETLKFADGLAYGVRLTFSIHTSPSYWLEVVKSCSDFAIAKMENDRLDHLAVTALETQKMSIIFLSRD